MRKGVFAVGIQLVVLKSDFCSNRKSEEGMIQESVTPLADDVTVKKGVGVVRRIQIPPPFTATAILLPSADTATPVIEPFMPSLVFAQVVPVFVE